MFIFGRFVPVVTVVMARSARVSVGRLVVIIVVLLAALLIIVMTWIGGRGWSIGVVWCGSLSRCRVIRVVGAKWVGGGWSYVFVVWRVRSGYFLWAGRCLFAFATIGCSFWIHCVGCSSQCFLKGAVWVLFMTVLYFDYEVSEDVVALSRVSSM